MQMTSSINNNKVNWMSKIPYYQQRIPFSQIFSLFKEYYAWRLVFLTVFFFSLFVQPYLESGFLNFSFITEVACSFALFVLNEIKLA